MATGRQRTRKASPPQATSAQATNHADVSQYQGGTLYGAQTQRALENFPISGQPLPSTFIRALATIKAAAAMANAELGLLPASVAAAICEAANQIRLGAHQEQFPVDIFQTGSGTSTNMNVNEVLANLASRTLQQPVHPNDQVNMSQSSNDVIPSAIHLAAALALRKSLLPSLKALTTAITRKARTLQTVTKTGRTHLMDAMPITLGQELDAWAAQLQACRTRIELVQPRLHQLALGGTAVGTGINAPPRFARKACQHLRKLTRLPLRPADNCFALISAQDTAVELSGQLKVLAVSLMKIANDLRWMNSGPLAGLAEIELPMLQAGSSIMPGKVNPVLPEAATMVAAQVIGNDASITLAGQSGNFQLNVMLPLIANNLLQSISLLSNLFPLLADKVISGMRVNKRKIATTLALNPILVTALNPLIGYERAAEIARQAYAQQRPILEVALEMTDLDRRSLQTLLNPARLTQGGTPKAR